MAGESWGSLGQGELAVNRQQGKGAQEEKTRCPTAGAQRNGAVSEPSSDAGGPARWVLSASPDGTWWWLEGGGDGFCGCLRRGLSFRLVGPVAPGEL